MDLKAVSTIVYGAISQVINDSEIDVEINKDSNLLDIFDSMDIVALIMETEAKIYSEIGKKIPLADEYTFDVQRSPFCSVECWLQFVNKQIIKC